jgi:hypothetical protein
MNVRLTLITEHAALISLVGDFARGLGCKVDAADNESSAAIRTELPDGGDTLLELLDYIALSATRVGVNLSQLLCRVTYLRPGAAAEVTLGLRLTEISLARSTSVGTQ